MKRFAQLEFRLGKKDTILVLSVFMVTLFLLHQSLRESKLSRREAVFRSEFLSARKMTVSSANSMDFEAEAVFDRSLIYNRNIRGPSIELCGTPCVTGSQSDVVEFAMVHCTRPDK